MKRFAFYGLIAVCVITLVIGGVATAKKNCAVIQDGTILYSTSHYLGAVPLKVGYDAWGYNYQAHMFKGSYANSYLGGADFPAWDGDDDSYLEGNPTVEVFWAWKYRETNLLMKWNDAWLSNTDCNGDTKLDRHRGFAGYIGSGAWLTNHQSGVDDGKKWTYFVKIVAAPADATKADKVTYDEDGDEVNTPFWYDADGDEIGPVIWGSFAVIQEVASGEGVVYKSPLGPGFGKYSPGH